MNVPGPAAVTPAGAGWLAALADEAFIAHVTPGSQAERLAGMLARWGVRIISG